MLTHNAAVVVCLKIKLSGLLLDYSPKDCRRHGNTASIGSDLNGTIFVRARYLSEWILTSSSRTCTSVAFVRTAVFYGTRRFVTDSSVQSTLSVSVSVILVLIICLHFALLLQSYLSSKGFITKIVC
jgi:hypothetical protein